MSDTASDNSGEESTFPLLFVEHSSQQIQGHSSKSVLDLAVVSNKYGIAIFGTSSGLICFPTPGSGEWKGEVSHKVNLEKTPRLLALSSDETSIAVVQDDGDVLLLSISSLMAGRAQGPGFKVEGHVTHIEWSENITILSSTLSVWSSDGTNKETLAYEGCTAFTTTGTELTVALPNGRIAMPSKSWDCGLLSSSIITKMTWINDTTLAVGFTDDEDGGVAIIVMGDTVKCTVIDTMCFPSPDAPRSRVFYLCPIKQWSAMVVSSSDSDQICVVANGDLYGDTGWQEVVVQDEHSASLPLSHDGNDNDTFVIGAAWDRSRCVPLSAPESEPDAPLCAPAPVLMVLTDEGYVLRYTFMRVDQHGDGDGVVMQHPPLPLPAASESKPATATTATSLTSRFGMPSLTAEQSKPTPTTKADSKPFGSVFGQKDAQPTPLSFGSVAEQKTETTSLFGSVAKPDEQKPDVTSTLDGLGFGTSKPADSKPADSKPANPFGSVFGQKDAQPTPLSFGSVAKPDEQKTETTLGGLGFGTSTDSKPAEGKPFGSVFGQKATPLSFGSVAKPDEQKTETTPDEQKTETGTEDPSGESPVIPTLSRHVPNLSELHGSHYAPIHTVSHDLHGHRAAPYVNPKPAVSSPTASVETVSARFDFKDEETSAAAVLRSLPADKPVRSALASTTASMIESLEAVRKAREELLATMSSADIVDSIGRVYDECRGLDTQLYKTRDACERMRKNLSTTVCDIPTLLSQKQQAQRYLDIALQPRVAAVYASRPLDPKTASTRAQIKAQVQAMEDQLDSVESTVMMMLKDIQQSARHKGRSVVLEPRSRIIDNTLREHAKIVQEQEILVSDLEGKLDRLKVTEDVQSPHQAIPVAAVRQSLVDALKRHGAQLSAPVRRSVPTSTATSAALIPKSAPPSRDSIRRMLQAPTESMPARSNASAASKATESMFASALQTVMGATEPTKPKQPVYESGSETSDIELAIAQPAAPTKNFLPSLPTTPVPPLAAGMSSMGTKPVAGSFALPVARSKSKPDAARPAPTSLFGKPFTLATIKDEEKPTTTEDEEKPATTEDEEKPATTEDEEKPATATTATSLTSRFGMPSLTAEQSKPTPAKSATTKAESKPAESKPFGSVFGQKATPLSFGSVAKPDEQKTETTPDEQRTENKPTTTATESKPATAEPFSFRVAKPDEQKTETTSLFGSVAKPDEQKPDVTSTLGGLGFGTSKPADSKPADSKPANPFGSVFGQKDAQPTPLSFGSVAKPDEQKTETTLGGLGFGTSTDSKPAESKPFGSVFGQKATPLSFGSVAKPDEQKTENKPAFGTTTTSATPSTPTFGATSFGTPAASTTAFGASFGAPTTFGETSATPSAAFGATSTVGSTTQPGFGQPASFGQSSSFGAQPAFGSPAAPTSTFGGPSTSQNAGFGALAQTGQEVFKASPSAPTTAFGQPTAAFGGQPTTGAFGSQPTTTSFSQPSGFGGAAQQHSAFGSIGGSAFGGSLPDSFRQMRK